MTEVPLGSLPPVPASVPPSVPVAPIVPVISPEERVWAMVGHLSAFAVFLVPGIGSFLGPLVVWLVKKDSMPFAAEEAREALNFNLTWFLASFIALAIAIPLCFLLIGFLLLPLVGLIPMVGWVFTIVAGLKANEGVPYRYPLTIRFVK